MLGREDEEEDGALALALPALGPTETVAVGRGMACGFFLAAREKKKMNDESKKNLPNFIISLSPLPLLPARADDLCPKLRPVHRCPTADPTHNAV